MIHFINKCSFINRRLFGTQCSKLSIENVPFTELISRDDVKYNTLPFEDIYRLSNDYIALSKSTGVDRTLSERFAAILLDYVESNITDTPTLTPKECLKLFEAQISTQSDKQITLFASQIFTLIKKCTRDHVSIDDLDVAVNTLLRLKRLRIVYLELLDFVSQNVKSLTIPLLVDFTTICHHNGLRAKHHLDVAYRVCKDRIGEFDVYQLLSVLRSFSYFSYEYKDIFILSEPKIRNAIEFISNDDAIMLLNVCKTLHKEQQFHIMRDGILNHILNNYSSYNLEFLLKCLAQMSRGGKTTTGSRFISKVLENTADVKKELPSCSIVQLSEIMCCINYWRIRMNHLTFILENLADRIIEVVNSRNLGVWADIYNTIHNTGWFSLEFMNAGIKHIISEPQVLSRVSIHQVVRVLQTFYKLRYFHKESYLNMLNAINSDLESLASKLNLISEVVLAAADGNVEMDSLYEKSLDYLSSTLSRLNLHQVEDPITLMEQHNLWSRNIITAAWGLAVMGFNKDSRYLTLLKTISLPQVTELDYELNVILMALELTESSLIQGLDPDLCHELLELYGDKMRKLESQANPIHGYDFSYDDNMRDHSDRKMNFTQAQDIHFHRGRMRATKHISDILYHIGRRDVLLRVAPHYNSPYVIDLCFSRESKKGIILFSGRELLRNHVDGKWSIVDTGSTKIKRHILKNAGWQVVEISCGEWSQLVTPLSRKQYVKSVLDQLQVN